MSYAQVRKVYRRKRGRNAKAANSDSRSARAEVLVSMDRLLLKL